MRNAPRETKFGKRVLPRLARLMGLGGLLLAAAGCSLFEDETFRLERELAAAHRFMTSLNYNAAADIYRPILEELEVSDPHWPEAAFGYATSLWHQTPPNDGLVEEASQLFERVAAERPGSDWALSARLNLARILMLRDYPGDAEKPEAARSILEGLVEEADGFLRHEAMVRLVETHRMEMDDRASLETARELLRTWLDEHPDNPFAALMWEQLGRMELLDFERPQEALAAFLEAEKIGFSDPSRGGLMLWRIAELARSEGRMEVAVHYYQKLVREAPSSGRAYEAQMALRKIRKTEPGMDAIVIPDLKLFNR